MTRYGIIVAACLSAAPLPAQAQTGTAEGPALGERMKRDLASLILPGASLDDITPDEMTAARGRLRTRPYATTISGICRRDEVVVSYAGPDRPGAAPAESAARPYGLTAEGWYRVLDSRAGGVNRGGPFGGECARLEGTEMRGWFVAPDLYAAAGGHAALAAAVRRVAEPRHTLAGCRESRGQRRYCRDVLSASALERIARINRCNAQPRRFCFAITMTDDSIVTLQLRYTDRGEPRIESVAIENPAIAI